MSRIEEVNKTIARESARAAGKVIVDTWLADHKEDFVPSDEHSQRIGQWLQANNREISYENLDAAFAALTAQGISFAPPKGPRVEWAKRHTDDFDGSPESWKRIDFYLQRLRLSDAEHNLEQAFTVIRAANPKAFKKPTAAIATVEDPLPETPPGCPVVNTLADVRNLSRQEQMKAQTGPYRETFLARVQEIIRRSGAKRPQDPHGL
jgi:hypothetical protein